MRLYLAGAESVVYETLVDIPDLRFLLSYHYVRQDKGREVLEWSIDNDIPVFLDSGAFSVLQSGAEIDLHEYIDFCLEHQGRLETVASLDVIGDHEATAANHRVMIDAGVHSIPTFHVRSPFSALTDLAAVNPIIALGVAGMQRRRNAMMAWLTKCFKTIHAVNPDCQVHGFALTSTRVMRWFPWVSVDSTTWLNGRKYGTMLVNELGEIKHIPKWKTKKVVSRIHKLLPVLESGASGGYEWYTRVDKFNAEQMTEWASTLRPVEWA